MTEKMFSQIFAAYINLDRGQERRAYMEKQLAQLGLSFQRFAATDGSSFAFDTKDKVAPLTSGELGCAHSHRELLSKFLKETRATFCLVMEDDIDISPDFTKVLDGLIAELPDNQSLLVQFDYAPVGMKGVIMWWFLFGNLIKNRKQQVTFWLSFPVYLAKGLLASLLSLVEGVIHSYLKKRDAFMLKAARKDHYLAGCYLVTRSAAEVLISTNTPIRFAADAVHNVARKNKNLTHLVCAPRLVRQKRESFTSTLNNDHFGKKVIAY